MKRRLIVAALVTMAVAVSTHAATLKISCGAVAVEFDLCKQESEAWARKTGNEVQVVATPNDSNERLALYQQILGSGSDKLDVLQVDIVWPGLLAEHLLDLSPYTHGAEKAHFQGVVANNTIDGKLLAMPWFSDVGLVYYRKDLLERYRQRLPATWDELTAVAKHIQTAERAAGREKMWGFVWQGRAYEGLTCNALEWIVSNGGGTIVDESGKVTINNPAAIKALDMASGWIGTITPRSVLDHSEEEVRGIFQSGHAVFMRNWPYAWALLKSQSSAVKGRVGVMALPKGAANRGASSLGGWQLAISRYSKQPALAADLVMYLSSAEVQKERALKGSFNPTIVALYQDAEVLQANPFMGELYSTLTTAVARPSAVTSVRYSQVSEAFWTVTHEVLEGKVRAADALPKLGALLEKLAPEGRWK